MHKNGDPIDAVTISGKLSKGYNYVGFTTFYPARLSNGTPQIGWSGLGAGAATEYMSVAVIGTPMGRVVEAYTEWAANNNIFIGTSAEELAGIASEEAVAESVSTDSLSWMAPLL